MATNSSNTRQGVRAIATTTTDPQRSEKRAVAARGAAGALALSVVALVVQSATTATPTWGYFTNPDAGTAAEKGYFGPWRQCKLLLYGREWCGQSVSRFQPVLAVWVAGLAAAAASALLGILVALAVLQLAMASSAKRVVISYSTALIGKVALATLASEYKLIVVIYFFAQLDFDQDIFSRFYLLLQLAAIALNFGVLVSAIYEGIYARRGGDPTKIRVVTDPRGATINNPGYREYHQPTNGGTISMTDASGKPYVGGAGNGSTASVATSSSVTSTASPLRSSLKKPKPLGIHNPGFSAHSPTLSRNGSQKKVRIQTHSTEV
ncbi:PREDICTED: uncharacterized protein LOC105622595 [Atta cephalotes]|uniref:Uncharacterized protein n=1 Tax=Atta cephalotes TaxID=12957 RepID=A0A158NPE4_ATTCE|nr:PREDICTED: uncharacterized protein LOC105622595 [Atta cephalotes]